MHNLILQKLVVGRKIGNLVLLMLILFVSVVSASPAAATAFDAKTELRRISTVSGLLSGAYAACALFPGLTIPCGLGAVSLASVSFASSQAAADPPPTVPVISSVDRDLSSYFFPSRPSSGPISSAVPGTILVLRGGTFEFDPTDNSVLFGFNGGLVVDSVSTQEALVAVVPSLAPGRHDISVTNSLGTSNIIPFTALSSHAYDDPIASLIAVTERIESILRPTLKFINASEAKLPGSVIDFDQLRLDLDNVNTFLDSFVSEVEGQGLSMAELDATAQLLNAATADIPSPALVPEPSTILLFSSGLIGLAFYSLWRRRLI